MKPQGTQKKPAPEYLDMRSSILAAPEKDKIDGRAPAAVICAVELGMANGVVTVWGSETGESSVYFSAGGGYIGGIGRPTIRPSAKRLANAGIVASENLLAVACLPDLSRDEGLLALTYAYAQRLLTAWRELEEQDPARREAVERFELSLERNPDDAPSWCNLGVLKWELGEASKAIDCLDRSIALKPDPNVLANRGSVYESLDDLEAAIRDFTAAIELDPGIEYAWYNRAMAHRDLGKTEKALADITESLRLEPDERDALLMRARLLEDLGREEEARQDFERARARR